MPAPRPAPHPAPGANDSGVVRGVGPLRAALWYATLGWRVVPIPPGQKHPAFTAWQYAATIDTDLIRSWWDTWSDHGIGIVTGPDSGLFVVDVDIAGGKRGDRTLEDLQARYGPLPVTATAITGSGGRHIYLAWPDNTDIRNDAGQRLGPGLDIRGQGGQVLAPPTIHPNGHPYQWEQPPHRVGIADPPPWLLELLSYQPEPVERSAAPVNGDRPGDRWATATPWTDILAPDGWTLHHVDRDGEHHWTRPGKDRREGASATIGHRGADVLKVFTSSLTHLGLQPEATYTKLGYLAATRHGGDHSAAARALAAAGWRAPPVDLAGLVHHDTPDDETPVSIFVQWPTFWCRDRSEQDWLFEPVLARGRGHAIYASHKTGKSLLMLWLAATLATSPEPIVVVYLDYEMSEDDLHERLTDMGYGPDSDLTRLHYALLPSIPPLDSPDGAGMLLRLVDGIHRDRPDHQLAVVIDTMSRAVTGEENSADTTRNFYRWTGMGLKQRGHTWARLDHSGKDPLKGQRGSSAKGDDVDVVWKLAAADDGLTMYRDAARMGWVPETVGLRREDDPLRFVLSPKMWPAGTSGLADELDRLEIPHEWGRPRVRAALREAGLQVSTDLLREALKYRRSALRSALGGLVRSGEQVSSPTPPLTCEVSSQVSSGQLTSPREVRPASLDAVRPQDLTAPPPYDIFADDPPETR